MVSLLFQGLDSELLFIYGLGLAGACWLSGVGARGRFLLVVAASLAAEQGSGYSGLSSGGVQAWLLCGLWKHPGSGVQAASPPWQVGSQPLDQQGVLGVNFGWRGRARRGHQHRPQIHRAALEPWFSHRFTW